MTLGTRQLLLAAIVPLLLCTSHILIGQNRVTGRDLGIHEGSAFDYLGSGLLLSTHSISSSPRDFAGVSLRTPVIVDLRSPGSYTLQESSTYYFQFDPSSCNLDIFSPRPDSSHNRRVLVGCLRSQVWSNEELPFWIKATGTAVILGTASGGLDEDVRFSIGFDELDLRLRQWFSAPNGR